MRMAIIGDWLNPNMAETARLLGERGVMLDIIYPEKQLINLADIRVRHDIYLLKSGTDLALSLAGALHEQGAATLNPYPTVAMMRNKIVVTRILQAAGVPVPDTYVTTNRADLAPLLDAGPLIIKPYRGSRGQGISVVRNLEALDGLTPEPTIFAQRYHQSDGYDHKVFCIGGRLFGVKRIFPLRTYADKLGEPFTPAPELCEIALRCGRILGIDLFGVDIVISRGQPYVVDINKFGSYMGVPDAPRLLADYFYDAGRRALRGESPVAPEGEWTRPADAAVASVQRRIA